MNFKDKIIIEENCFPKIRILPSELIDTLNSLKNNAEFSFDRLSTIIAVDLTDKFELIYDLHSIKTGQSARVSVLIDRDVPKVPSVVEIFKSAYFDECEIFDLFGVDFDKNPNLKRLFMPKGWIGHPLRKDYAQDDPRLNWNEVYNG